MCLHFAGPTWHQSRDGSVLLASRPYNGSRSRKTKGSLADTLQCNIWRRAQTPHRMTHCLHGGDNHGSHNGFTALGKTIGTSKSTETDTDYVTEHRVLKYLRNKIAHYLHDYRRHWFCSLWASAAKRGTRPTQPESDSTADEARAAASRPARRREWS
jgi:hypothetical protein